MTVASPITSRPSMMIEGDGNSPSRSSMWMAPRPISFKQSTRSCLVALTCGQPLNWRSSIFTQRCPRSELARHPELR